jgi:hypothetical protein
MTLVKSAPKKVLPEALFEMLLHNVKQHNVNVTGRNVTKCSCTQRKGSKTLSFQNVNVT